MANLNFRIVEGDDFFESVKDDFLTLYLDGVKVQDIQEKLNITKSQYMNFLRRLRRTGDITTIRNPHAGAKPAPKHDYKKHPRYYSYNHHINRWTVTYKSRYYACFRKKEQAQCFVELMRECDWDKSKREDLKWRAIRERPLKKGVVDYD